MGSDFSLSTRQVGHGFCGLLSGDLPGCVVPQSRFAAGAPGPPCGCPKPALCTIRSGGQPCTCRRQDVYLPPFYHLLGFHRAKDADAATYRVESLGPVQQLKKGTPTGGPPLTIKEFLKGPSEGPHRKKEKKKKKKKKKKGESTRVTYK